MRVIVLVIVLLIVGAIGFAGVSVWQGWQPVWGYFQMARGYSPAKTPEEALEKFNKAIKERDYYTVEAETPDESLESPEAIAESIKRMEAEMKDAAKRLDFERAAELRDRLRALRKRDLSVRG